MAIDFDAVDGDAAAVGSVKSTEEMEQRAFAAAGWTAERDGLALAASKSTPRSTVMAPSS